MKRSGLSVKLRTSRGLLADEMAEHPPVITAEVAGNFGVSAELLHPQGWLILLVAAGPVRVSLNKMPEPGHNRAAIGFWQSFWQSSGLNSIYFH